MEDWFEDWWHDTYEGKLGGDSKRTPGMLLLEASFKEVAKASWLKAWETRAQLEK